MPVISRRIVVVMNRISSPNSHTIIGVNNCGREKTRNRRPPTDQTRALHRGWQAPLGTSFRPPGFYHSVIESTSAPCGGQSSTKVHSGMVFSSRIKSITRA